MSAQVGRTAFSEVPLVDVSALRGDDADARSAVVAALDRAAREVGFIYVAGHGIAPEVIEGLKRAARSLFALPLETKLDYYIGKSTNHRGYVPKGEEYYDPNATGGDLKEAFDTALDLPPDDPDYLAGNRMLGPNVWPAELAAERALVDAYYGAALDLGKTLLTAFEEGLGVAPGSFTRHVTKPTSQLRLIHYWETDRVADPDGPEGSQVGIGAHTDFELFTILLPTAPGLQVLNGEGRWIDVPPVEGAFVINIGDMLEVWSNGLYTATSHRVGRVNEERYAFPLFFATDYDVQVAPLPELVPAGTAPRYAPISAGEHLVAQTIHAFRYLQGETTPEGALAPNQFGRFHLEQDAATTE